MSCSTTKHTLWDVDVLTLLGCLPTSLESLRLVVMHLGCFMGKPLRGSCQLAHSVHSRNVSNIGWQGLPESSQGVRAYFFACMHACRSSACCSHGGTVALECSDECAAVGVQELFVQAHAVVLDAQLQAEVAARGQEHFTIPHRYNWVTNLYDSVKHLVYVGESRPPLGVRI